MGVHYGYTPPHAGGGGATAGAAASTGEVTDSYAYYYGSAFPRTAADELAKQAAGEHTSTAAASVSGVESGSALTSGSRGSPDGAAEEESSAEENVEEHPNSLVPY
jgi:hypothetical protein